MNKKIFSIVLFVIAMGISVSSSAQCAMCKAAAESSLNNGGGGVEKGINNGIIYLMGVPYMLLATFCFIFRKDIAKVYHAWRGNSPDAVKTVYQQYRFLIGFFIGLSILFLSVAYFQLSK